MAPRRLYLDSNFLIAVFETREMAGSEAADRLFSKPEEVELVTSELTIGEVLVGPLRTEDRELERPYRDLLEGSDLLAVRPVNRETLFEAARLRSLSSMRLPDAVHVATAVLGNCAAILSSDRRLFIPPGLAQIDPSGPALNAWFAA